MSRLLTCGWESGNVAEPGGTFSSPSAGGSEAVVSSSPAPRSPGSYGYKVSGWTANPGRTFNLGSAKTELWLRFGLYIHSGTAGAFDFLNFYDSANSQQGQLNWTQGDQLLRVYRGTGSLLGTSALQFSPDQWHTVEVRWQITSTTVGTVEVWVDDTRWLNLTGIDNTQTGNANLQYVRIGASSATFGSDGYEVFDDLAINDTAGSINNGRIGDGRVVLLKPTGAGSTTELLRGGTDTGANWSQVNEVPVSMTQYAYEATAGKRDLYALANIPAGTWTVNACEVLAYALNSDAGAGSIGLTVKSGATTDEGSAQTLTTSAAFIRRLYETDPNTAAAWTNAAVDALEAGVTVR